MSKDKEGHSTGVVATCMEKGITYTFDCKRDFYGCFGYDEGEAMLKGEHKDITAVEINN